MDWCGRVGEIRELFRSRWEVIFEWCIPKIFSMPDKVGPVYYSPELIFLDDIWCLGIYRNTKEWIGLEIWRSQRTIQESATFSIGVKGDDLNDDFIHYNQRFPEKSRFCSLNEFLLKSALLRCKAEMAPLDVLTVNCTLRRDEPCQGEGPKSSQMMKFRDGFYERPSKSGDIPKGNLRKVLEGVQWKVLLPPQQTHWDLWSPSFTCGEISCRFNLYPGGLYSDGVYLRFCISVPSDAGFPLRLGWQSGVLMGDGAGIRWLMDGKEEIKEDCSNKHAQQIRVTRAKLEGWLSSDKCLTIVHRVSVGELCSAAQASTQTEGHGISGTEVSCGTQTEVEAVAVERGSQDVEDFDERWLHFQMWLKNPEEADRIRQLRLAKFEAHRWKSLLKDSGEKKESLFYVG